MYVFWQSNKFELKQPSHYEERDRTRAPVAPLNFPVERSLPLGVVKLLILFDH